MGKRGYDGKRHQFRDPQEIERVLIERITNTGREQLKKRRKAGLSSYYSKDGKIIEILPDNAEVVRQTISSKWVVVKRENRKLVVK